MLCLLDFFDSGKNVIQIIGKYRDLIADGVEEVNRTGNLRELCIDCGT